MSNASATKPKLVQSIELKDAPENILLWVEKQLEVGGFLAADQVNGQYGASTVKAFQAFKEVACLEHPTQLGAYTLDKLALLAPRDKVSEQSLFVPTKILTTTGTKTGVSKILPVVGQVWESEEIVQGSRLTWGEISKGLTRLPAGSATFGSEEQLVQNMIELAKVFRVVRDKFGSPLQISSGYRPHHLPIGASRSQHKFARALDLVPFNRDYKKLLAVMEDTPEVTGIGLGQKAGGFLHLDIRRGERVIFSY
jgi:hypothetical protein